MKIHSVHKWLWSMMFWCRWAVLVTFGNSWMKCDSGRWGWGGQVGPAHFWVTWFIGWFPRPRYQQLLTLKPSNQKEVKFRALFRQNEFFTHSHYEIQICEFGNLGILSLIPLFHLAHVVKMVSGLLLPKFWPTRLQPLKKGLGLGLGWGGVGQIY